MNWDTPRGLTGLANPDLTSSSSLLPGKIARTWSAVARSFRPSTRGTASAVNEQVDCGASLRSVDSTARFASAFALALVFGVAEDVSNLHAHAKHRTTLKTISSFMVIIIPRFGTM